MKYILIITVVLMICFGQILFKVIAKDMPNNFVITQWVAFVFAPLTLSAFVLYGIATFLWIYVLKLYPLSMAYPFMALAFVVVPIASFYIFHEEISLNLIIGSSLIVIGIIVAIR